VKFLNPVTEKILTFCLPNTLGFLANFAKQRWYNQSAIVTNVYSIMNAQYLSLSPLLRNVIVTRCVALAHGQSHVGKVFTERVYYPDYYATVTQT
jgi:hypothetical protein